MTRGPRFLVAAVLTAVAGTAFAVPAHAAACEEGAGVTVVVDYASLGGGTRVGCAAGDPSSGIAALRGAGHEPTRAAQEAGYFVCRIDGKPASDPCQRASPADAYWSYWHAQPGGSWTYSSTGPADYDPKPGSVEGWAFGAGNPPSSPPPRAAAKPAPKPSPTPSPAPKAPAPKAPAPKPSATTQKPAPADAALIPAASADAPTSAPPSAAGPSASAPAPTASVVASATATAVASGGPLVGPVASSAGPEPDVVAVPAPADGDGSLVGPLLAAGVLALLAAGATHQLSQRRRRGEAV